MPLVDDLFDLQIPNGVQISPNSQQVLYCTTPPCKASEHAQSTLWLAETGKAKSSRQLTPGLHNDREARWSPDGKNVAFLSDRAKTGESCAIYLLPLGGGEAYPVTPTQNERAIDRYEFSPDGKTIAYVSADEKTEGKKAKEKAKDDAQVWGEDWPYNRFRMVHLATKAVSVAVAKDAHVAELAWNDDGTKVAFSETRTPNIENKFKYGTSIFVYDVKTRVSRKVCHFATYTSGLIWSGGSIYFIGPADEHTATSSQMVFRVNPQASDETYTKHDYGETNCAVYGQLRKAAGDVAVGILDGMADQIRVLSGRTLYSRKQKIDAWDAAFTKDSDEVVLALATSDINHPVEVFTTTASGGALVQLSDHGHLFTSQDRKFGSCRMISCPSTDGVVQLQAPFYVPSSAETKDDGTLTKPRPTVVLVHGGPYSRKTESFDALFFFWAPLLLDAGYALLATDYRGSSARGDKFARYGNGVGKYDYADVIAMTQYAIEQGFADKERLVVGGWSQGGFMSFLCSVRNGTHAQGWKFNAAIPGAGVSDCDTMTLTSDIGAVQAQLASGKPWLMSKDDVSNRQGSAIWEFGDALRNKVPIPPMLILHGEKDERVPLEQGVGMRRAMEDAGVPCEFVVYPREGHEIKEKHHLLDMGRRVVRFVDTHING
ncbi:hypothetical protein B0A50_02074 [Salinomyces thailandicus]|uniref:Dipeptidyl-peptidase V n=1 Tax=Salinomyces thailandicus TaxID=706561 RepID=A0A4U0UA04_9PEZI|nr:hypothetical protein B0A50_02074 [Salinomyces thailandica]